MSASLTPIYGEAAPKSRTRDLPLMGEGTYPQHDCFLKNRRGIVLRISRARSPIGLLVRKRQHLPNFKSRISLDKAVCNLDTQHPLSRYHRPLFQSALTELKHVKLAAPTTVL
ncbi:hypothetical protein ACFX13_036969 [Malus domestica]